MVLHFVSVHYFTSSSTFFPTSFIKFFSFPTLRRALASYVYTLFHSINIIHARSNVPLSHSQIFTFYRSSRLSFHPRNVSNLHQDPNDRQIVIIDRAQTLATWTDSIRSNRNSNPIFKIPPTWRFVCVPISSWKIRFLST